MVIKPNCLYEALQQSHIFFFWKVPFNENLNTLKAKNWAINRNITYLLSFLVLDANHLEYQFQLIHEQ